MTSRSVGIISSAHGSGATHLGIALANYAASGLCQKTAYADLEKAGQARLWGSRSEDVIQTRKEVVYYSGLTQKEIPLLLNKDFKWIVFDFGVEYQRYREEFLRCDVKLVVLNLSSWYRDFCDRMVQDLRGQEWGEIHPRYLCTFYEPVEKKDFEKTYQEKLVEIPIFHHPFCIKKEQFDLLGDIIKEAAPRRFLYKLHIPGKERH